MKLSKDFLLKKPNIQTFRDYKRFQDDLFKSELDYELSNLMYAT